VITFRLKSSAFAQLMARIWDVAARAAIETGTLASQARGGTTRALERRGREIKEVPQPIQHPAPSRSGKSPSSLRNISFADMTKPLLGFRHD
jgi:hypothetical protein